MGVLKLTVRDETVKTPFILVSVLFHFPEFLFILLLVECAHFFEDIVSGLLDASVRIVESTDDVGEESSFMVVFIRQ